MRAIEGARSAQSRPYWIRYLVAFWAWEKLKWAKDNVLLAIVSSLAPGLISAGIGAALSDHKWRAAAYATLSTYAGLFALFLMWDGLKERLASTKVKLAALQAAPPAVDVELLEIHLQAADTALDHVSDFPVDRDIFLRVKLVLREPCPIEVLAYELNSVLHGNAMRAHFIDDIQDWGLVTDKKPIGVGATFRYTVTRLTKLAHHVEGRGIPVEGWLHFRINAVREKEIAATTYRLTVSTPKGSIAIDRAAAKSLTALETTQFKKIPYASTACPY